MDIDEKKIDDVVLALLWLTRHDGYRAWKGLDWATTGRLFKKGMIDGPVNKSKSLIGTPFIDREGAGYDLAGMDKNLKLWRSPA